MAELYHKVLGSVGPKKEETINEIDLKSLIELGCIKEEVMVGPIKFLLRSLSAVERMMLASEFNGTVEEKTLFDFNIKLLSLVIEKVDGKPLESYDPDYSGDPLQVKQAIISSFQAPVIAKLLEAYALISERCDSQFGLDQVKK